MGTYQHAVRRTPRRDSPDARRMGSVINSPAFRGASGGLLPREFWRADADTGVRGGVEFGFMSCTPARDVAFDYAAATVPSYDRDAYNVNARWIGSHSGVHLSLSLGACDRPGLTCRWACAPPCQPPWPRGSLGDHRWRPCRRRG